MKIVRVKANNRRRPSRSRRDARPFSSRTRCATPRHRRRIGSRTSSSIPSSPMRPLRTRLRPALKEASTSSPFSSTTRTRPSPTSRSTDDRGAREIRRVRVVSSRGCAEGRNLDRATRPITRPDEPLEVDPPVTDRVLRAELRGGCFGATGGREAAGDRCRAPARDREAHTGCRGARDRVLTLGMLSLDSHNTGSAGLCISWAILRTECTVVSGVRGAP